MYANKYGGVHCSGLPVMQLLQLHMLHVPQLHALHELIMMSHHACHNLFHGIHARKLFLEQSWAAV